MERERLRRLLAVAWVCLGLVQIFFGYRTGDTGYAVFGAVFALLGAAYYYAETHADTRR